MRYRVNSTDMEVNKVADTALHEGEHFGQREGRFLGDLFGFLDGIFWSHTARASEGHEKQSQAGPKSVRVQGWGIAILWQ